MNEGVSNAESDESDWPADATTVKPLTPAAVAMLEIAKESA